MAATAVEFLVANPVRTAALYGALQSGASWIFYKYSKFQLDNIRRAYNFLRSRGEIPKENMPRPRMKRTRQGRKFYGANPGSVESMAYSKRVGGPQVNTGTNVDIPRGGVLKGGVVDVGQLPKYTTQKSSYGRKPVPSKNKRVAIFRWQSLSGTKNAGRSLSLVNYLPDPDTISMPMYAFNLSAIGGQGRYIDKDFAGGTQAAAGFFHDTLNVPMYKLNKHKGADWLDPATRNYRWTPVRGQNNHPDNLPWEYGTRYSEGSYAYCWDHERLDDVPNGYPSARHLWSQVRMLIECSDQMNCKIHVAVAKLDDTIAPSRHYTRRIAVYQEAQPGPPVKPAGYRWDENTPLQEYDDVPGVGTKETQNADAFWESFWSHRVIHPLATYSQPNKHKFIKFLKHEVINVNPYEYLGGEKFQVQKDLMVFDGRYQNLTEDTKTDAVRRGTYDNINSGEVNVGPVQAWPTVTPSTILSNVLGYNQMVRIRDLCSYQDRYKDTWLLVWMDGYHLDNTDLNHACSFDMVVRSKFELDPSTYREMKVTGSTATSVTQ